MLKDNNIAMRIKFARNSARMTQQELADKIGVSLITINRWENPETGRSPNSSMLNKIAGVLGISVGYLMGLEDMPERLDSQSEGVSLKENMTHETNTNMATITLENGKKVEAPATPEGYAFLERLFLLSMGGKAAALA